MTVTAEEMKEYILKAAEARAHFLIDINQMLQVWMKNGCRASVVVVVVDEVDNTTGSMAQCSAFAPDTVSMITAARAIISNVENHNNIEEFASPVKELAKEFDRIFVAEAFNIPDVKN